MRTYYLLVAGIWMAASALFSQEAPAPADPGPSAYKTDKLSNMAVPNSLREPMNVGTHRQRVVDPILNGTAPLAGSESQFNLYFDAYLFARMTQSSDDWLGALPRERKNLLRQFILGAKRDDVHAHLVNITFNKMKDVATQNYHPAVRHNAMQIIADLNQKEAAGFATNQQPEAYSPALAFMVDQIADPKQLDAVRIAAAFGVIRHADLDIARAAQTPPLPQMPAATRTALVARLLPVVSDRSTHYWLRARVLEAITALTQPAVDDKVVAALVAAVADDKEPSVLRLVAAASLGRLNLATATASGKDIARDLAKLGVESSQPLLAKLEAQIAADKLRGGNPTSANDPRREEKLAMTRSALRANMEEVKRGLQGWDSRARPGAFGASSAAKGADPAYFDKVIKDVQQLIKVAETPRPNIVDLTKDMRAPLRSLEILVQQGGGRIAPPPGEPTVPAAPAEAAPATAPVAAPAPMAPVAAPATAAAAKKAS